MIVATNTALQHDPQTAASTDLQRATRPAAARNANGTGYNYESQLGYALDDDVTWESN